MPSSPGTTSQIVNRLKGFTLIELLVVMGILGFILTSTALFLSSVLKGANQSNIVSEVKQNGQVVLDAIDRQIRNAASVEQIDPDTIQLALQTGTYIFLSCNKQIPGVSNGWIGIGRNNINALPATFVSLTNRDTIDGVDIECDPSGAFLVSGQATDPFPQVVKVSFKVSQALFAVSRTDFQANAQFETTVSLRKY